MSGTPAAMSMCLNRPRRPAVAIGKRVNPQHRDGPGRRDPLRKRTQNFQTLQIAIQPVAQSPRQERYVFMWGSPVAAGTG